MVEIFLKLEDQYVSVVSIPLSDIENLSLRPLKWLRFVLFSICGAYGHLSATPNGHVVDYNITALTGASVYYYNPDGAFHIIDLHGLNDNVTSSELTTRASNFRNTVVARDGPACVVTGAGAGNCDAAHIIPLCKGDEYFQYIIENRNFLYNPILNPQNLGINSIENAIFLRKDLHSSFGNGEWAFLKTPNFALDPADIPRVENDQMPASRITLQHFQPIASTNRLPVPQFDARIAGNGTSPPPDLVLDYAYGVAAYKRWGSEGDIKKVTNNRFIEFYRTFSSNDDDDSEPENPTNDDTYSEPDDLTEDDTTPGPDESNDDVYHSTIPTKRKHHRSEDPGGRLDIMDTILGLSMLLQGRSPESMANERRKQEELAESQSKEASKLKVQQWVQSSIDTDFQSNASAVSAEKKIDQ